MEDEKSVDEIRLEEHGDKVWWGKYKEEDGANKESERVKNHEWWVKKETIVYEGL